MEEELLQRIQSGETITVSQSGIKDLDIRMALKLLVKTSSVQVLSNNRGMLTFGWRPTLVLDSCNGFNTYDSTWDYIK